VSAAKASSLRQELSILRNKQVLLALLMTVLGFGGVFTAFTYIAPILTDISGFSSGAVTMILLLFGVGMTAGNMIGGRLSDWKLMPALVCALFFLALVMAVFTFSSHNKPATLVTVLVWGFAAFVIVPGLQMRVLNKAKGASNLASSLNISSFNLGNAAGAYLGGIVTFGGLIVALITWSLDAGEMKQQALNKKLNPGIK
jgi:DHA1 family inner membrane transport protein